MTAHQPKASSPASGSAARPPSNRTGGLRRLPWRGAAFLRATVRHLLATAVAVSFLFPLYWMFVSSLKDDAQITRFPPVFIPSPAYWENFAQVWRMLNFGLFSLNTLVRYAVPATLAAVLSSAVVAYGFSRIHWPGRDVLFGLCIATMAVPYAVTMVPVFILVKNLRWINTYLPLVVPSLFGIPYFIFLLRQFFRTIPQDLSDAARVDGANEWRIFLQVMLPLAKPALAVVALLRFMWAWNDFLGPLIYINQERLFPVALGIQLLRSSLGQAMAVRRAYSHLMAGSTIAALPVLVIFFFAQRTFIEGISLTGLKG